MSKAENPVIHVLDRMVEVALGDSAHFKSHADALHVPFETVKSWKRRRKVPLYELELFAERYGVTIDWLLHGDQPENEQGKPRQVSENVRPHGLSADEAALLETYRTIDQEARVTLQNLLRVIAGGPAAAVVPKAAPRQSKTAVVLDAEYKGKRTGPQIFSTEYTGKRTGPTVVGQEAKAAPKKKRKDGPP